MDKSTPTLIFTEQETESEINLEYVTIDFTIPIVPQILHELHKRNIRSLMVEGGTHLLNGFIQSGFWDEANVFVSDKKINTGVYAPLLIETPILTEDVNGDRLLRFKNQYAATLNSMPSNVLTNK